jgi:L-ribulose-5-phosphate 4-epimerase
MFAQAHMEIPCLGTTHADHFYGNIPLARLLTEQEVNEAYEKNTGIAIVEKLKDINPLSMPGVLLASHAPFTWCKDAAESVKHSLILERIAEMAFGTLQLKKNPATLKGYILDKHYKRKHGPDAYYGQK